MLLERERELEALSRALAAACEGEGSVVLVQGETGVGKSELLLAAEDTASGLGMTVLAARGSELDAELPFGVIVGLLEPLVAGLPEDERDRLFDGPAGMARPLFPALRAGAGDEAPGPLALVHGAYWLFARLADLRPLLVLVDDAEWADERSAQVLRHLAARIEDLPAALVVAGTSGLDALAPGAPTVRLRPEGLSPDGVAQMVLAEFPDADAAFCAGCARATNGVPMLVTELLAAVRNDHRPPTGETAAGFARLGPPEVAQAVLRRLERLPPGTPALARVAAVLGDDASLEHTARLAGIGLQDAAVAVEALCATGVVEPGETIRFRHPIVRAALERSVPPAGRERTHLQAARLLLGDAAPPERVAGHLLLAERGGRRWVVETLRRAAAHATAGGAPASAARYLERALAEPPPGDDLRGEVLRDLAGTEAALLAEAREEPESRRRARQLAGAAGDADVRTPAGRALAAQRALEAALAGAPADEVRDLAAAALAGDALLREDEPGGIHATAAIRALALADDLHGAALAAATAVDRARESGSPEAYARACALRADVALRRGALADAVADARAALDAAPAAGGEAAAALAVALAEHGERGRAREALDRAAPRSTAVRASILVARAHVARLRGDRAEARDAAVAAGRLTADLQADTPAWLPWRAEAAQALVDDDRAEARRLAREHLRLARRTQAPRTLGAALRTAGVVEGGAEGLRLLREAARVFEGSNAILERAHTLAALGAALRDRRDPIAARAPLREALAIARRCRARVLEDAVHDELAASGERVTRASRPHRLA
jgi:hypothetical protein